VLRPAVHDDSAAAEVAGRWERFETVGILANSATVLTTGGRAARRFFSENPRGASAEEARPERGNAHAEGFARQNGHSHNSTAPVVNGTANNTAVVRRRLQLPAAAEINHLNTRFDIDAKTISRQPFTGSMPPSTWPR